MINFVNVSIPITDYKNYDYIEDKVIYRFNSKTDKDIVSAVECTVNKNDFNQEEVLEEYKKQQDTFYKIKLNRVRQNKINDIIDYDSSDKINTLTINGITGWLNKQQRSGLYNLLNTDTNTITLWLGNNSLDIDKDTLKDILNQLEQYAYECYNVTALHKKKVNELTNIEDIEKYDFTKYYPNPLNI